MVDDFLDFLDKKTADDPYQIVYALNRVQDKWQILSCVASLLGRESRKPLKYQYDGNVLLIRKIVRSGLSTFLREVVDGNSIKIDEFKVNEELSGSFRTIQHSEVFGGVC